ncbi:dependent RNA helicase [Seminavis robusta]|uniref:Dependent RNA helicase n=1 Tax=Seminavis robusta TaxID=568900 RepID=A0A9N8E583_9STRA|nr:dependent RNA helicase [Seminavis robusta]|eukprot:Sro555_g165680.1 dependent RNA helicase (610) ;mRNA; f:19031-20860
MIPLLVILLRMSSKMHWSTRSGLALFIALSLSCLLIFPPRVAAFSVLKLNSNGLKQSLPVTTSRVRVAADVTQESSSSSEDSSLWENDARLVDETFSELYGDVLPPWLLNRLNDCGWTRPTLIQKEALDTILRDKEDAVIQAQTGSGKTLSFLLPILANVDPSRAAVQALIVVPSRELGLQVGRVAKRLAAKTSSDDNNNSHNDETMETSDNDEGALIQTTTTSQNSDKIMIMTVLQGSQNRRQRAWAWAEPPQVVIGTPEELCNMVRFGGIKRYNSVKYLIVDEVDACLLNNAGTLSSKLSSSSLHELLSKHLSPTYDDGDTSGDAATMDGQEAGVLPTRKKTTPRPLSNTRQTIFCSATIPQHRHFMKQCVQNQWILSKNPKHVCLRQGEQLMPPTLDHAYMVCASSEKKLAALRRILKKIQAQGTSKKVLIFTEPQRPMEEMAQVVAKDLEGLLWKEVHGPSEEAEASAVVSVLRYEDSLSQRAAAIQGFTGGANKPINSHQWKGYSSSSDGQRGEDFQESNGKMRVLFSSDLAARGLDIEDITHVIQLDLAPDADSYVHRSGRTGRFGASGQVVSIITPEQEFVLNRLANKLQLEMDCIARQKKK